VYLIQVDHIVYGKRHDDSFTLPEALWAVHGTGNARILRADGTVIVENAGSDYAVRHVPTGRIVKRRQSRRAIRPV